MAENNTQNPLKRIEEISANEIAKATHIEVEYVNHIVNKNFSGLKGKNVKAFIKIIEREFNLDLGAWVDEYKAYTMDALEDEEEEPKFKHQIAKEEIVIKDHSNLPKYLLFTVLFVILGWAIYNFKLYDISKFFGESNQTVATYSSNSTMIQEVGDKLEKTGIEILPIEQETKDELNALEKLTLIEAEDENMTFLDENMTFIEDENLTIEEALPLAEVDATAISIIPTDKVWIGIITLENSKKETITTEKEHKFDLEKEQLILTGHGLFSLNSSGNIEKFNDKNPHRFHIKDGKITQISYEEFLKLNKGKAW